MRVAIVVFPLLPALRFQAPNISTLALLRVPGAPAPLRIECAMIIAMVC